MKYLPIPFLLLAACSSPSNDLVDVQNQILDQLHDQRDGAMGQLEKVASRLQDSRARRDQLRVNFLAAETQVTSLEEMESALRRQILSAEEQITRLTGQPVGANGEG